MREKLKLPSEVEPEVDSKISSNLEDVKHFSKVVDFGIPQRRHCNRRTVKNGLSSNQSFAHMKKIRYVAKPNT